MSNYSQSLNVLRHSFYLMAKLVFYYRSQCSVREIYDDIKQAKISCCCTLSEAVYISSFFTVTQTYQLHLFLCASSTFLLHLITLISHLPFRPEEVGQWKRNITDSYTLCYLSVLLTQTFFFFFLQKNQKSSIAKK